MTDRAQGPDWLPTADRSSRWDRLQVCVAGLGVSGFAAADALLRLGAAVTVVDARDADQVQVVFGSVAFADWLAWVASLQSQHIRLDTGRIEALSSPGLVSVTATFTRAKSQ